MQVEPQHDRLGHGQRDHLAAIAAGDVADAELIVHQFRRPRIENVPIHRPPGFGGDVRHELAHFVAEQANAWQKLNGGALVASHHPRQVQNLVKRRMARGHRLAVGVVMGGGQGGGKANGALLQALGQQPLHGANVAGAGPLAHRPLAHDHPPQGAVSGKEASIEAQIAVELTKVVAETAPVPSHSGLQAGLRHAFHPGQHAQQVGRGLGTQGRDAESAMAPEHGGHAVEAGGA